ncbi:MAG: hypothetical protein GY930_07770 [bacterium]|nr:hypothetical protein [bacterium]
MNARKLVPLLFLVLMAGGTHWVLDRPSAPDPLFTLDPDGEGNQQTEAPDAAHLVPGADEEASTQLAGQASTSLRSSAAAGGPTISVRVAFPVDCPIDPSLRVLALPKKKVRRTGGRKYLDALVRGEELDFPWSSAPVGANGYATLPLPADIIEPALILDGEFLYLKKGEPVDGQTEIILSPPLGSSLHLTLTTPDGSQPQGTIRLMGGQFSNQSPGFSSRVSPVEQGLIRGLAPDLNWMIQPQLEQHFSHGKLGVKLNAGERREVQLDLEMGCIVQGSVVDDDGQPLAKISVELVNIQPWARMTGKIDAKTDEDGHYSLGRIGSGPNTIRATEDGRRTVTSEELDLIDGETREDVHLVLSLGKSIAGTVYLPDGKPARGAFVSATHRTKVDGFGPMQRKRNQQASKAVADKQGYFKITGLEAKKYAIRARKAGRGSLGTKATFHASAPAVEAGTAGLRMDLEAPLILKGRVLDEQNQPVTAFRIKGKAVDDGGPEESQKFTSEDGTFQFEKLGTGRWRITANAEGYHQDEAHTIPLPANGTPLIIVLQREGSIAGQVLSPSGLPVPGAVVRANNGEGQRGFGRNRGPRAEADEEGLYLLDKLDPGTYQVTASSPDWADNEQILVDITPGLAAESITLQLRTGGSISGIVLESDGSPMTGRNVHWGDNAMAFASRGQTKTDSAGRFEFKNVTPGKWQVSAAPSFEEMGDRMQGRSGMDAMGNLMSDLLTQSVQVFERENTHIELGGEPKAPVVITGRVLYQGRPLPDAQVVAVAEGQAIMQGMKTDKSATDGTFELTVDRPGAHVISAHAGALGMETLIDVPSASDLAIDLVIPSGGISGAVRTPDGKPASGIRLSLQRNDGLARVRFQGSQTSTDVDGVYTFDGLQPGSYTVRANSSTFGGGNRNLGTETRENVRVTDDGLQRADFHLQTPGTVHGTVRGPGGLPLAGVSIFFRDSSGLLVRNLSRTQTDASGQFEREGLTPGNYTISARSTDQACEDTKQVSVRDSKTTQVQLNLEPATTLLISLLDLRGTAQRLRVEVLDHNGLHVETGMTPEVMRAQFRQGTSSSEKRVGPLPPGEYLVKTFAANGDSAEKTVRLTGGEQEKAITLRLTK